MCKCESWVCIGRLCFEASFELILLKESKEVGNYTLTYSQYRSWSQSFMQPAHRKTQPTKSLITRPSWLLLFFTLTCFFNTFLSNLTSPAQRTFSRHLSYSQLFSVHVKRGETTPTLLTCGWAAPLSGWSWFPPGSVEGPEHSAPSFSSGTLGLQGYTHVSDANHKKLSCCKLKNVHVRLNRSLMNADAQ